MASDGNLTVIGRSSTFRGELSGEGDVLIDGTLEGSVHVPGARITVGAEATVRAVLSAQEIIVQGYLEGELRSTGLAALRSTATVVGDVFAARLSVQDEASLHGRVDVSQAAATSTGPAGAEAKAAEPKSS